MSFFLSFIAILQSFSISLGVGCSTLAVLNFFAAIRDGIIDDTERRMMGVVYIVLRVAMALILTTSVLLIAMEYSAVGLTSLSAFTLGQLLVIFVLFTNAMMMTAHLVPSTFGPAIQAGSWYTLGTLAALLPLGYINFTFGQFLMGYATWIILAIGIINGVMAMMKAEQERLKREAK